jgi:two-component system, LytTR family, response regulator
MLLEPPLFDGLSTAAFNGILSTPGWATMIRTVLADDEVLARQKLRQILKEIGDIDVVGECASAHETIELAKLTNPDLLFLDIRMSDMDGFDVVQALSRIPETKRPQIVFVTANDGYAVRAFEIQAIDYVLKPYTVERLRATLDRVREHASMENRNVKTDDEKKALGANHANGQTLDASDRYAARLVFKSRGRILFLPVSEIRWIEADENYVRICTGSESHLLREAIGHIESRLDPQCFLRVHRSAIVNLQYVKEVQNEPDGDATVILMSGERIAMSRSYKSRIQKLLQIE